VVASGWGSTSPLALPHPLPILPNCCEAFASHSLASFDPQLCETRLDPSRQPLRDGRTRGLRCQQQHPALGASPSHWRTPLWPQDQPSACRNVSASLGWHQSSARWCWSAAGWQRLGPFVSPCALSFTCGPAGQSPEEGSAATQQFGLGLEPAPPALPR